MSSRAFIWGFIVVIILLILGMFTTLFLNDAYAEDRATWFKNLKQPGNGASCCDFSDCKQTEAEWKNGQWWANVRGVTMPVPPERELRDKKSIDGEAYVCSTEARKILCFVPPAMAM